MKTFRELQNYIDTNLVTNDETTRPVRLVTRINNRHLSLQAVRVNNHREKCYFVIDKHLKDIIKGFAPEKFLVGIDGRLHLAVLNENFNVYGLQENINFMSVQQGARVIYFKERL